MNMDNGIDIEVDEDVNVGGNVNDDSFFPYANFFL